MKSKKKQRILALILSMVLMLSASISALAQGDVQTEASGTETTENQAAAQSLGEETVPETEAPAEEAGIATQSAEITEEPVEQETADQNTAEQGTTEQNTAEQEPQTQENPEVSAQTQEASAEAAGTVQEGTSAAADNSQENISAAETAPESEVQNTETQEETSVSEEQSAETTEETVTEETVVSEAAELKQEFTDEDGNVTQTVTAYVPEGAFQATADQISMEVKLLNEEDTNYIKGMMEEKLPEDFYLDGYVLYQIDFKVNGEITKPAKAITISMTGNELAVEDTKNAHVFYYVPEDPEAEGDEDQLTEVTQKDQLIRSLEESGQSTENIEDYDYSEITVNEGNADTITVKGWESTIYGCYVEKEMAQEVTYEDDTVKVTVSADEKGIIPNKTTLQVVPISNSGDTKDQYKEVEKKLQEKAESEEYEIAGFLAYDISFVDKDGKEVEPDGEVRVSLEYKNAALPEGLTEEEAKEAEVSMLHLEEDEKGEVKDVVDMAEKEQVEAIATTESQQVEKVAVKTESFSTFTIIWGSRNTKTLNIQVVDQSGKGIGSDAEVTLGVDKAYTVSEIEEKIKVPEGYTFSKAVYGWNFNNANTEVLRIRCHKESNWGWTSYQNEYSTSENGDRWNDIEYNIYFIYTKQLGTIDTVDSRADGIKLNLFDYSTAANNSINQGEYFNFTDDGVSYIDADINTYHSGTGNNAVYDGIFKTNMSSENDEYTYPEFSNIVPEGYSKDASYLFSTTEEHRGKTIYPDVNHLFTKDGDGYYIYDSSSNYAYYDKGTKDFIVYDVPAAPSGDTAAYNKGNFFPFNPLANNSTVKNTETGLRNFETGDGALTKNVHFGMTMETSFIQPAEGKVNDQDMIFEFTGDDDVWVFIDGVLVLDIGGIHDALNGTINFATGKVTVTGQSSTTIKALFEKADRDTSDFTGDTFSDYTDHKINFYYLERGAGASNCKLKFNIQSIPEDDVIVEKQLGVTDFEVDQDFTFKAETSANGTEWTPVEEGITYTITNTDGSASATGTVGENGEFTLKAGQRAVFSEITAGTYFRATETSNGNFTTSVHVTGDETTEENLTGSLKVRSGINRILFINTPSSSSLLNYDKTAKVEDYDDRVYEINLSASTMGSTAGTEGDSASIVLVLDASSSLESAFTALQNAAKNFVNTAYANASHDNSGNVEIAVVWYNGSQGEQNYNNTTSSSGFKDVETATQRSELISFINNKNINGGTPMGDGLRRASEVLSDAQYPNKYVLLFTDGRPGFWSGGYGNESMRKNCMVANSANNYATQIKESGTTIYTVGYGSELEESFNWKQGDSATNDSTYSHECDDGSWGNQTYISTTGEDFLKKYIATSSAHYFHTNSAEGLNDIFVNIAGSMGSNLTTATEKIEDVIDPRFNLLVPADGNDEVIWSDGTDNYRLARSGDTVTDNNGNSGTVTLDKNGNYTITWNGVTIENAKDGGWSASFFVKAKEDFMGGNAIPTNGSGSGIYLEDNTIKFPMPTVNVKLLDLKSENAEDTYFKGESISAKDFVQKLADTVLVEELVPFDETNKTTIPLQEIIGLLNDNQLTELQSGQEINIDYSYGDTKDNVGTFNLKLEVVGDKGNLDEHMLTSVGDAVEEYKLTVTYTAKTTSERNPGSSGYKSPVGNEVTAVTTEPTYTVNVVAGSITISKTVSVEDLKAALGDNQNAKVTFKFTITGTGRYNPPYKNETVTIEFDQTDLTNNGTQTEITKSATAITDLAQDEYTVSENAVNGFEAQSVVAGALDGSDFPVKVATANTEDMTANVQIGLPSTGDDAQQYLTYRDGEVTFTNSKVISSWDIVKVSETNTSLRLPDATFTLSKDGKVVYTGESDDGTGVLKWKKNGVEVEKIEQGIYILEETSAPTGYQKSAVKWEIEITKTGALKSIEAQDGSNIQITTDTATGKVSYLYTNKAVYDLPSAGGPGIFLYMIGGTLLLMAGSLMIYINRRKGVLRK